MQVKKTPVFYPAVAKLVKYIITTHFVLNLFENLNYVGISKTRNKHCNNRGFSMHNIGVYISSGKSFDGIKLMYIIIYYSEFPITTVGSSE